MGDTVASGEMTIFHKLLRGEIPADVVYETDKVLAFRDIQPQAPTHILIISKTYSPNHRETPNPEIFQDLMVAAQTLANTLKLENYRLVMNNGAEAGQSVFYMHLHLLAGRPFGWPPG